MANNKTTGKTANKKTGKPANNNAVNAVNSVIQSEAISELTSIVRSLMQEISQLKAKVNSEITVPANKTVLPESISELLEDTVNSEIPSIKSYLPDNAMPAWVKPSANKTPVVPVVPNKKVNVVPPANGFILLAEGTVISELVMIASIGTPFGSKYGPRQAINCVTAHGNTLVAFINCVRDALGNTIPSGLVGGGKYVMTGTATGKTSEFNSIKSNVIGKTKFALVS